MSSYCVQQKLPASDSISYITFSLWDHITGPSTKSLWISKDSTTIPDESTVKIITQLIMKSVAQRDVANPQIDFTSSVLTTLEVIVHGCMFSARGPGKDGRKIYCLALILPLHIDGIENKYLQYSSVYECFIKHHIQTYRVHLDKVCPNQHYYNNTNYVLLRTHTV